ncbi:MAG: TonB family protein [Terriglobus sp.]
MKIAALSLAFALTASSQETPQQPVHASSVVMAGQVIHRVAPQYPREALEANVSGTGVLHVIIGEDGLVRNATVISGPQMLRQSYLDAIRQWVYKPYLLNGKPVPVDTTITMSVQHGGLEPPLSLPVQISSGVLAGMVLTHPVPTYPHYTKDDNISGPTLIHVLIGEDGHVLLADVISGPPPRTPYELEAVKHWTYKPYLLNGKPEVVESNVTFQPSFGR